MVKNLPASAGDERDKGSVSGLGRSPRGGRNGNSMARTIEYLSGKKEF